jgi:hypothetical protein
MITNGENMPIKYYPNRIFKKITSPVDRMMINNKTHVKSGQHNLLSEGFNDILSSDYDFEMNSIKINFSSSTSREYFVKIIGGRRIVQNYNDYLWFSTQKSLPQKILLDPGFYNGEQMAILLEYKLNSIDSFPSDFAVEYSNETGKFKITANSEDIKYLDINPMETLRNRDSIAGHLFGFNATTEFEEELESDTAIFGLNSEVSFISHTNTVLEHYFDDKKILSMDQALLIGASAADVIMSYEINYKEIV